MRICKFCVILISFIVASVSQCDGSPESYFENLKDNLYSFTWAEEETLCLEKTISVLDSVQNHTLWASWIWDAMETKPMGHLYGSNNRLGNFDQCLNPPWSPEELETQYCLVDFTIIRTQDWVRGQSSANLYSDTRSYLNTQTIYNSKSDKIYWGICAPAVCSQKSIEKIFRSILMNTNYKTILDKSDIKVDTPCQRSTDLREYTYSRSFYLFWCSVVSLAAITIISTYVYEGFKTSGSFTYYSNYMEYFRAFSLTENYNKLFIAYKGEVNELNGIRFYSCLVVVVLHKHFFEFCTSIANAKQVEELLQTPVVNVIFRGDLVVDTFFWLSGMLLVTTSMSAVDGARINPVVLIVKRYLRLVPPYAAVVFYVCAVFPHTGSGPHWARLAGAERAACRRTWPAALLMAQNYYSAGDMCHPVGWSTAADFHLSVAGVLLLWALSRRRRAGLAVGAAAAVAAAAAPGLHNYAHSLPAIVYLDLEVMRSFRTTASHVIKSYISTHLRATPFCIGMIFGFIVSKYKPKDIKNKMSKSLSVLITMTGVCLMYAVGEMTYRCVLADWSGARWGPLLSAAAASLQRPTFALGGVLVVAACLYGDIPAVRGVLAWPALRPLARLSYAVYHVHPLLYARRGFVARAPPLYDLFQSFIDPLGVLCASLFFALVMWLLLEAPVAALSNLLLTPKRYDSKENRKHS